MFINNTALIVFLVTTTTLLALSSSSAASVDPTSGDYRAEVSDLSVKVVGGSLSWTREYEANAWRFAPTWSALRLEIDALDDTVARIDRAGDLYEKIDSAGTLYRFDERLTIRKTEAGWRWADRDGNWVEYTATGRPTRLGNRVGNTVTLNYQGEQLASVVDPMNRTVFTVAWANGQIASVKDHTDREVRYSYTGGLLTQVTDVRGKPWKYEYTGGKLTKLIDPLNHATTITLSAAGRARVVTDPVGAVTRYAFDYLSGPKQYYLKTIRENGELQEVTETWTDRERELVRRDVNGVTLLTVVRDGRNRIHTDYRGRRTTYLYDEFRNPTGVIYPDGSKMTSTYDAATSNLLTTTNEIGTVTQHQYYANGLRRRTIAAKGTDVERITEYAYDPQGRLTTITQVGDAVTQGAVTRYTYDDAGNVATITDAEGAITKFEDYDALGNAWVRIDTRNKRWTQAFDPAGLLTRKATPLQHVTTFEYDAAGRRIKVAFPATSPDQAPSTLVVSRDKTGNVVAITDAIGGTKTFEYDKFGNTTLKRDESGVETRYTFDSFNRLAEEADGVGNSTRYVFPDPLALGGDAGDLYQPVEIAFPTRSKILKYDSRGRVWKESNSFSATTGTAAQVWTAEFDGVGNIVRQTYSEDRVVTFEYDPLNRVSRVGKPLGVETRFAYDNRSNVLAVRNALGNSVVFSYDRMNRMMSEGRPMGEATMYSYHQDGSLAQVVDAVGNSTRMDYDDSGRRHRIQYFDVNSSEPAKTVTFAISARNRLLGYDDGVTKADYVYDSLQRKSSESVDYGDVNWKFEYGYQANGRKSSVRLAESIDFNYGYDAANRLQSISLPGSGSIQFGNYLWMRPQEVKFPGGVTKITHYDGMLRATSSLVKNGRDEALLQRTFQYDVGGKLVGKNTEHGSYAFEYDALGRLTRADYPNGLGINGSMEPGSFPYEDDEFSYDAIGNRLTSARKSEEQKWVYNANSELLSAGDDLLTYDKNGSALTYRSGEQQESYRYDPSGRLIEVRDESNQVSEQSYYDPFGRRLWVKDHRSGRTTYFGFVDEGIAASWEIGGVRRFYGPYASKKGAALAVLDEQGQELVVSYPFTDERLAVDAEVSASTGQVVALSRYSAFGEAIESRASAQQTRLLGMVGASSTRYNNWMRDYAPELGRYLQLDRLPNDERFRDYRYASNDPIGRVDPVGLRDWEIVEDDPSQNNTVICDGDDGYEVVIGEPHPAPCGKYINPCIVVHEQLHITQWQAEDADRRRAGLPGICEGQAQGAWPWAPGDEVSVQNERAAYKVQAECLWWQLMRLDMMCEGCFLEVLHAYHDAVRDSYRFEYPTMSVGEPTYIK